MYYPPVTIITPVYNCEKYISRTIQSVFEQTYQGIIDYVVIDDGSTDRTPDILKSWLPYIRAIRQANVGEQNAVNRG